MSDQSRDVGIAIAAIVECDRLIASYEAEAEKVTFDPGAHAAMLFWADRHRADKQYWEDELPKLVRRLADVGS